MRDEYDFSDAERGKFYKQRARLRTPVYLDEEVLYLLDKEAKEKGIDLSEAANRIIRKGMDGR